MNHRISLIIVLYLLAGMSWAQSWLSQALPGEPAFRLLECGYREAQLETCRPILPISTSWAVETEEKGCQWYFLYLYIYCTAGFGECRGGSGVR